MIHLRMLLHAIAWIIFFFEGVIDALALPGTLMSWIAMGSILGLVIIMGLHGRFHLPLIFPVLGLVGLAFYSGRYTGEYSWLLILAFLRQLILLPYLYFLVLVNERSDRVVRWVTRLVVSLVLLQIPAFLIKLAVLGGPEIEDYVGTVSMLNGSMAVLITMIPMVFAFSWYLASKNKAYLALSLLFVLLSQINGKRTTLLLAPILMVMLATMSLRSRRASLVPLVRGLLAVSLVVAFLGYAVVRINPWLNPDGRVGGRFDPSFVIEFVVDYNFGMGASDIASLSRFRALPYVLQLQTGQGWTRLLSGGGAGSLSVANRQVPEGVDPVTHFTGVRYGARGGAIWIFLQVGILGLVLIFTIGFALFREFGQRKDIPWHMIAGKGILAVVAFDVLIYSTVTLQYFSISGMVLSYAALFYRDRLRQRDVLASWAPARSRQPRVEFLPAVPTPLL